MVGNEKLLPCGVDMAIAHIFTLASLVLDLPKFYSGA
jgi:hypothetical protein